MHTLRSFFALALAVTTGVLSGGAQAAVTPPAIGHVFVIVLENESFEVTFGPKSPARYLARTLPAHGVLLTHYYGTGHYSLDNYLAMISGQAANPDTRDDCETFSDFVATGTTPDGQAIGHGCVYPASVLTLADELKAVGKDWRGYFEDMGNDTPARRVAARIRPLAQRTARRRLRSRRPLYRRATSTLCATTRSSTFIRSSIQPTARPTWCGSSS